MPPRSSQASRVGEKAQYGFQGDQFLTLKTNKNSLVDPK
jgi:hypothetical protein